MVFVSIVFVGLIYQIKRQAISKAVQKGDAFIFSYTWRTVNGARKTPARGRG